MFASFLGGTIGAIAFLFAAPQLAKVALEFGSVEVFALILFTMVAVATIGGGSRLKGLLMSFFGLFLATIGMDVITGTYRYTFGVPILAAGVSFIPAILGLFAVSEALRMIQEAVAETREVKRVKTVLPSLSEIKKLLPVYLRQTPLGLLIGAMPGVGATTAAFVGYATEARISKEPEKFGTGIPEGIAAPETANNAAAMGAMVPMMSLGIPGSATTAVMLAAIILHGLRTGPFLFERYPEFVGAIMLAAIIANILILAVSPMFIRFFTQVFRLPLGVLGTIILILCVVGGFAIRNNMADVWMVFAFGILGYVLEKHKFPLAPVVIGLVLGELFEQEFRRSLTIAHGSPMIFFTKPIATPIIIASFIILLLPVFQILWRRFKAPHKAG
jgi:putative tricarboxylic transport membrane protein